MAIKLSETYGWIVEGLAEHCSVADSMQRLIDRCEAARPHPDWAMLRRISYGDLSQQRNWIERLFQGEPAARLLSGLWFGLINLASDDGETADLYVSGSERFYPLPGDNSWAVGAEWWPDGRYADAQVLAEVYQIAYHENDVASATNDEPLKNDAEYPLCLGYAAFAVQALLGEIDQALILRGSMSLGIAVGFDSGDFILLGELTVDGLRPLEPIPAALELPTAVLREHLRSTDERIVWRGLREFGRPGSRSQEVFPDLIHLASAAPEPAIRKTALSMLADAAPDDSRVRAAVLEALEDQYPRVRREALGAMMSWENLTSDDLTRVECMRDDPDKGVASLAEVTLDIVKMRQDGPDLETPESEEV